MTSCPYCGGSTKRITCGAKGCQLSMDDAASAAAEYRAKMTAYRATPKQRPLRSGLLTIEEAKAIKRDRALRRRETASKAQKIDDPANSQSAS